MCLIAFAWQVHPRYPLLLIGNRDEFHARDAAPAEFQPDAAQVYGGRDLEKLGSWLQVSTHRRLATVTNVREGLMPEPAARSRGALVADFVRSDASIVRHLDALAPDAAAYGRFNLLLWDGAALAVAGNHPRFSQCRVEPGVHGLSNGPFDAPWPKVRRAQGALARWISEDRSGSETGLAALFDALADDDVAPDHELPETGIGLDLERLLSPPFVRGARYGTRCSSVLLVGDEAIVFAERRFGPDGVRLGESVERLALE